MLLLLQKNTIRAKQQLQQQSPIMVLCLTRHMVVGRETCFYLFGRSSFSFCRTKFAKGLWISSQSFVEFFFLIIKILLLFFLPVLNIYPVSKTTIFVYFLCTTTPRSQRSKKKKNTANLLQAKTGFATDLFKLYIQQHKTHTLDVGTDWPIWLNSATKR